MIGIRLPLEKHAPRSSNGAEWFLFFARPYAWPIIGCYVFRIVEYVFWFLMPVLLGKIISVLEAGGQWANVTPWIAAIMFAITFIVVCHLVILPEVNLKARLASSLQIYSLRHFMRMELSWHENHRSGGSLAVVSKASDNTREAVNIVFHRLSAIPAFAIVSIIMVPLLSVPWQIAALCFVFGVVFVLSCFCFCNSLAKNIIRGKRNREKSPWA